MLRRMVERPQQRGGSKQRSSLRDDIITELLDTSSVLRTLAQDSCELRSNTAKQSLTRAFPYHYRFERTMFVVSPATVPNTLNDSECLATLSRTYLNAGMSNLQRCGAVSDDKPTPDRISSPRAVAVERAEVGSSAESKR